MLKQLGELDWRFDLIVTDLDARISIQLPADGFERISARLGHGDITVTDTTRNHVIDSGKLQLDLLTADGSVRISQ